MGRVVTIQDLRAVRLKKLRELIWMAAYDQKRMLKTKKAAETKNYSYGPKKTKLHKEAKISFSLPSTQKVDLYYFAKV